ncbi:MAG: cell division topological specificity factor MinE [Bacillota bacterium]|nr:MAG: cell division topological specificity factor MinE [Bacillota bacterium]
MASHAGFGAAAPSKSIARERLKIVLVQDRAEANRGLLEKLKGELVDVVSRYAEVETDKAEVKFVRLDSESALVARLPVRSLKRST